MKLKKVILPLVLLLGVVSCGSNKPSTSVTTSANNTSSNATSVSSATSSSTVASKTTSQTSKPSSQTSATPGIDYNKIINDMYNSKAVTVEDKTKDYKIFSKAPVISFTTKATGSTALDGLTKPGKGETKPKVDGTVKVYNCPEKYQLLKEKDENNQDVDVSAKMKIRGNFTSNYDKKAFQINFTNKQNLFGLNGGEKYKKWVLLADVKDTSLMRNALAMYLSRNIAAAGLAEGEKNNLFSVDFTPVHLYLNGQYWGMYLCVDQKEVGKTRENITETKKKTTTDIGYFFELDHYYTEEKAKGDDGDPTFEITYSPAASKTFAKGENDYQRNNVEYGYTISSDINDRTTQVPFIKNVVEKTYTVIEAASRGVAKVIDEETGEVVNAPEGVTAEEAAGRVIDINTFVSSYLISEIACDPDIGYSSFYFSYDNGADGDKKLRLTCPWDFDTAFGIRHDTVEDSKGLYASKSSNPWFNTLGNAQWFKDKVKAKWDAVKATNLFTNAVGMIDDLSTTYEEGYNCNYSRWPNHINGKYNLTSSEQRSDVKALKTEKENANFLKNWFNARVTWLDKYYGGKAPNSEITKNVGTWPSSGNTGGSQGGWWGNDTDPTGPTQGGNTNPGVNPGYTPVQYNDDDNEFKSAAKYKFEAENATLTGSTIKTTPNNNPSGGKYIGSFESGATITFKVNSASASGAYLYLGLAANNGSNGKVTSWFTVTVNGVTVDVTDDKQVPSSSGLLEAGSGVESKHDWFAMPFGAISLNAGENTIVLTTVRDNVTNFDYIEIQSPVALS